MAAKTELSQLLAHNDPLLNFRWVIQESFANLPHRFVERIDIPFNNIQLREGVYNASSFTYYPGFHNVSGFGITFYEDDCATVTQWIEGWKNAIKDFSTGLYNLPVSYKHNLEVILIDAKGDPIVKATLEGIFPTETSNFSLEYSSSSRISVEQQFSCDNCKLEYLKSSKYPFTQPGEPKTDSFLPYYK
jgi:hypothetical protein